LNDSDKDDDDDDDDDDAMAIGGGSYWAGRAAARPLFYPYGPPMRLARPLLSTFCPANTLCFVVLWKYFLYFITLPHKTALYFVKI